MINENFKIPARTRLVSLVCIAIGIISLIWGAAAYLGASDPVSHNKFFAVLLQHSVYALLMCVASIFILAVTSLAQAAWIVSFRRIPEAIGSIVWILGAIVLLLLLVLLYSPYGPDFYKFLQKDYIPDNGLNGLKKFFLSKPFFTIWTALTIFLWGFFGRKFSDFSLEQDRNKEKSVKIFWKNYKFSAAFVFVFALTLASTIPWMWLMSLDAHWFSTMFSWYTFASSFVSGMSMVMLFILWSKRNGNLELVNEEHIHDVGKFMFAFSIFWTYLWFSQFMLIWYANIPEETVYFKPRMEGSYKFFFWSNLILNFVSPILILMSRPAKRNYFVVSLVAVLLLLGHWIDFFQMVLPSTIGDQWGGGFMFYEIGILLGFVGLIIFLVSSKLAKTKQIPENHPYFKETVIHIS